MRRGSSTRPGKGPGNWWPADPALWLPEGARPFRSRGCLVCGAENESGLRANFYAARGRSLARARPGDAFQGFPGMVHGGVLAALLDDAMWYAVYSLRGIGTLTGSLGVRYRNPAEPGRELLILGEALPPRHGVYPARAVALVSDTGQVVAEGEGRFREADVPLPEPRPGSPDRSG